MTVTAKIHFLDPAHTGGPAADLDLRTIDYEPDGRDMTEVQVTDAHEHPDPGLYQSGFELVHSPSAVTDFYDCNLVMETYYEECKALARELTGAHTTFTYDHIIREAGSQYTGGGKTRTQIKTGIVKGGGYINSVHMDYTDNSTWDEYLAIHGEQVPKEADHVYSLNFWRPLSTSVDDNPLAVCDARTVRPEDLQEVIVYGYGAENYSWYDIGINTYSVSVSERQQWYYYPKMTPEDVLVFKSYDSDGVIGRTCPHASFAHPNPIGEPRRSIELRVLCFC